VIVGGCRPRQPRAPAIAATDLVVVGWEAVVAEVVAGWVAGLVVAAVAVGVTWGVGGAT
jgi:hypothetical protein